MPAPPPGRASRARFSMPWPCPCMPHALHGRQLTNELDTLLQYKLSSTRSLIKQGPNFRLRAGHRVGIQSSLAGLTTHRSRPTDHRVLPSPSPSVWGVARHRRGHGLTRLRIPRAPRGALSRKSTRRADCGDPLALIVPACGDPSIRIQRWPLHPQIGTILHGADDRRPTRVSWFAVREAHQLVVRQRTVRMPTRPQQPLRNGPAWSLYIWLQTVWIPACYCTRRPCSPSAIAFRKG